MYILSPTSEAHRIFVCTCVLSDYWFAQAQVCLVDCCESVHQTEALIQNWLNCEHICTYLRAVMLHTKHDYVRARAFLSGAREHWNIQGFGVYVDCSCSDATEIDRFVQKCMWSCLERRFCCVQHITKLRTLFHVYAAPKHRTHSTIIICLSVQLHSDLMYTKLFTSRYLFVTSM